MNKGSFFGAHECLFLPCTVCHHSEREEEHHDTRLDQQLDIAPWRRVLARIFNDAPPGAIPGRLFVRFYGSRPDVSFSFLFSPFTFTLRTVR
jgi:hypothetical protein